MSHGRLAVLHVALQPVTGPWSVMRSLARAQAVSPRYAGVGVGVVHYDDWPAEYREDLDAFRPLAFRARTPRMFGTASFAWQLFMRPPIARWVRALADAVGAGQVVVHFHNAWLSGAFVPLRCPGVEIRTVATFHGIAGASSLSNQPVRRRLHRWMAGRLAQHGTALTSVDASHLDLVQPLFGLDPAAFDVVPNGAARSATAARSGPLRAGALTIAHVGTLNSGKGWRIAAEAVLRLQAEHLPVRLLIAGSGPDEAEVAKVARDSGGAIEYLGYMRDPAQTVLPAADLLVLMTDNDGLPMAVIEALSCAVPVIATRIGGLPEAVRNGESGCLIERNSVALADTLRRIQGRPDLLARLSAGALEDFSRRYEMDRIVDAYDRVYRRVS